MHLSNGSTLQEGKYRIVSVLGQGGFGITYLAQQVMLGREVAVKEFFMKDCCEREGNTSRVTVPTQSNRELVEKFKGKFVREARMIASLGHSSIVHVIDVFEENGTAYYVMESLPGGSLAGLVKASGPLPEPRAVKYVRQVASALEYIHKRNLVHLDVKPSNILLNEEGDAVLIDFGISKHYDSSGEQTSSTPVGISKGYAPLEQGRDGDVSQFTPATDIYALGATLYCLVTGSTPPEASVVNEDGLNRPGGISDTVWNAIQKAMQPRRKDRPQTVSAFLSLLDGAPAADNLESESIQPLHADIEDDSTDVMPRAESAPESRLAAGRKGRPLVWALALSLLFLLLLLFLPRHSSRQTAPEAVAPEEALPTPAAPVELDRQRLIRFARDWNDAVSRHDLAAVEQFYLPNSRCYLKRFSPAEVRENYRQQLDKYPYFSSILTDITTEKLADDVYIVRFIKHFDRGDGSSPYVGPAYIQVEYRDDKFHVVVDSDPLSDSNGSAMYQKVLGSMTLMASDQDYNYYWGIDGSRPSLFRRRNADGNIEMLFFGGPGGTIPYVSKVVPVNARNIVVCNGSEVWLLDAYTGRANRFAEGSNPTVIQKDGHTYIRLESGSGGLVYYDTKGNKQNKI